MIDLNTLSLVSGNNPILRQLEDYESFDFDNPVVDPQKLFEKMLAIMADKNGIGLAAPQVGLSIKMFVIGDPKNRESVIGAFNPIIVDYSSEEILAEEGCLSYPDLWIRIKRPKNIQVRFTTWDGTRETIEFKGMTARIFQHEYDHLHGVVFQRRANLYHLQKAKKELKKLNRIKRKRSKDSSLSKHSASSTLDGGTNVHLNENLSTSRSSSISSMEG
jgi:peptide deformylase